MGGAGSGELGGDGRRDRWRDQSTTRCGGTTLPTATGLTELFPMLYAQPVSSMARLRLGRFDRLGVRLPLSTGGDPLGATRSTR